MAEIIKGTLTKVELEKKLNAEANGVSMFVNWTNEDFTCSWDSIAETFKAGSVSYLPNFKFLRYSKHLVDREMNKLGLPTNHFKRNELTALCSTPVEVSKVEAVQEAAKEEFEKIQKESDPAKEIAEAKGEAPKKKGGLPKKVVVEEKFEGLDEGSPAV